MTDTQDYRAYDAALAELDPVQMDAGRKEREKQKRRANALAAQARLDAAELIKLPTFRRYFFGVLASAGIYMAVRHAQPHDYAFEAGRRALGLELLNTLLAIAPQFAIDLSVEQAKLEEKVNDNEPRNAE